MYELLYHNLYENKLIKYLKDNILSFFIWSIFISVINVRFLKLNENGSFQFIKILYIQHKNSLKLLIDFFIHFIGFTIMKSLSFYFKIID